MTVGLKPAIVVTEKKEVFMSQIVLFHADGSVRKYNQQPEIIIGEIICVRSTRQPHVASVELADIRPADGGQTVTAFVRRNLAT